FCSQAGDRVFDLGQAPLAAASLLRLADGRVVVHLIASHMIFDGWAASVFIDELAAAYRSAVAGQPLVLPTPAAPMEFASEEQQRFEGPEGVESLAYWKTALASPPPPLG